MIHVLLLENIHQTAAEIFQTNGCRVTQTETLDSISTQQFQQFDIIGIRSKTKLTKHVLQQFTKLKAIGCYCIGTDQVDIKTATEMGIAIFNSAYGNSRSVAEIVIAQIINLARQLGLKNTEMHNGVWNKSCSNCFQILGKTLGIIGYGHIGSQVGVLAENIGMYVNYYDIQDIMGHLNNRKCETMEELLQQSDFVTLHVPSTPQTNNMMNSAVFEQMKKGSYIINYSRNNVVNLLDLHRALKDGHLAGAALDVFPNEPKKNQSEWKLSLPELLEDCKNVILTPHIGGSTMEAQDNVAKDTTTKLLNYLFEGK